MSIVTKRGDTGMTGLMYNRRVPKCHPRVEAYGCVDELNAALGLARATVKQPTLRRRLAAIQKELVVLMGELATAKRDLPRYAKDGFALVSPAMTAWLEEQIAEVESRRLGRDGWATPGANPASATLDLARTVCRRAERQVCALRRKGELNNPEVLVYLNRLADLLWLFARWLEPPAKPWRGAEGRNRGARGKAS